MAMSILQEQKLVNKRKITMRNKVKITSFIFFVLIYGSCLAQKDSSFIIKKLPSDAKNNIYSQVKIKAYDAVSKEALLPIIRIDGVSFPICDSNFNIFYVSKGRHQLTVGRFSYEFAKSLHFRTKLTEDYEITVYLKPYNKPLH